MTVGISIAAPTCIEVEVATEDIPKVLPTVLEDVKKSVLQRSFVPKDTLLIFDWDDTLLPTTWLREQGLEHGLFGSRLSEEQQEALGQVSEAAEQLLKAAKVLGTVAVVTNGEAGWVEGSCKRLLPQLLPALSGVTVLSARSTYEPLGVSSPLEWKVLAFQKLIRSNFKWLFRPAEAQNVLSIGDSNWERDALIRVSQRLPNCCGKTVKLLEQPSIGQILEEQRLLLECLPDIVQHQGTVNINVAGGDSSEVYRTMRM